MAEKAALNIARYIRDAPSMKRKEINVTLYKVLIAVKEVTVETSVTLTYHEEEGEFINILSGFNFIERWLRYFLTSPSLVAGEKYKQ